MELEVTEAEARKAREALLEVRDSAAERRRRLDEDLSSVIAASTDVATDDEHDPEGATIAYERSRLTALIAQADEQFAAAQAGLDRLIAGTYGRCERCGDSIAAARLEALPTTRTCRECAGQAT
jgi:RNA polymerase-binding transcription factor DksA